MVHDAQFLEKEAFDSMIKAKMVRFSYLPKPITTQDHFFWIRALDRSLLCTLHQTVCYCWDFACTSATIQMTAIWESAFPSKVVALEASKATDKLAMFNTAAKTIQSISMQVHPPLKSLDSRI